MYVQNTVGKTEGSITLYYYNTPKSRKNAALIISIVFLNKGFLRKKVNIHKRRELLFDLQTTMKWDYYEDK